MQLNQKEQGLMKDLKNEEKLCAEKYSKHANTAKDPQLRNLFSQIATIELGHLNTLEKIESGTEVKPSSSSENIPTFTATYQKGETEDKKSDCFLCMDLLTGEKHASALYNTCIFEFVDENTRKVLNHIQKEEQEHGKMISEYMTINNMIS